MKKYIMSFGLVITFSFILINSYAQQQPPDTGTGGGGGTITPGKTKCYDSYQTGGNWVITKCNTCSSVGRVNAFRDENTCGSK